MRTKKVRLADGSEVEGAIVNFQPGGEHWNEYLLEDGTVLKVKLVATEVIRVDDHYDNEGNPVYVLQSTNVLALSVPEKLKRKE